LAGSAANLGAVGFREHLREVEQAGREADWPTVDRLLPDVEPQWDRLRAALEQLSGRAVPLAGAEKSFPHRP
jgi:hypothetical protein